MISLKLAISCVSCLFGLWLLAEPIATLAQTSRQVSPTRRVSSGAREGLPGRRAAAGTRGNCEATTSTKEARNAPEPLRSLTSEVLIVQSSTSPTLSWYIPETEAKTAELRIVDETDKPLSEVRIALTGKSGVTSYRIPTNKIAMLQPNRDYRWQFSLLCNPKDPSKNPWVEGSLRRVNP
jgi:hypothetical protein